MSDSASAKPAFERRQIIVAAAVFACVLVVLAVAYFLFLRPEYRVLYANLRATDASAIVAELDARGIAYRLRDGGTTILVSEDESDASRLAIAGSEAAAKGLVGFELFNESDMGLTNFAQKINYQRALQGELVRTIMMIDGVESARVHLAIPERALFRGERSLPKAAVTIAMIGDWQLADARVAGSASSPRP
jgi:flagellar M-ring protein FliF